MFSVLMIPSPGDVLDSYRGFERIPMSKLYPRESLMYSLWFHGISILMFNTDLHKPSKPDSNDACLLQRLYFLKVPQPLQTIPPTGTICQHM